MAVIVAAVIWLSDTIFSDDPPVYRSLTCNQWLDRADRDLAGSLDVAYDYAKAVQVLPRGTGQIAEFGDIISGECAPTRLKSSKIFSLRNDVRELFLERHPAADVAH